MDSTIEVLSKTALSLRKQIRIDISISGTLAAPALICAQESPWNAALGMGTEVQVFQDNAGV